MVRKGILLLLSLILVSCEVTLPPPQPLPLRGDARLLLYIHSTAVSPPEIEFEISGIEVLKGKDWLPVSQRAVKVNSIDLVENQRFLAEARLSPGLYSAIRLRISKALLRTRMGVVNLALPEPDGVVVVDMKKRLERGESYVVSLNWDSERSIKGRYRFQPPLKAEGEAPSPKGLLLFVSNMGSDYVSVIDRGIERVIGAITVGDGPSGMALNRSGDRLYVVNARSGYISVIDTTGFTVIGKIYLTAGRGARDVAFVPEGGASTEGKLYIVNTLSDDVSVVDTVSRRMLKTLKVGRSPSFILADTERKEVYVTNEGSNSISIIDATKDEVVAEVHVGSRPKGLLLRKGKDRIYVFNEGSGTISVISPSSRKVVETLSLTYPPTRGVEGFDGRMFVVNTSVDSLSFYNAFDVLTRSIDVGPRPLGIGIDEKRNRLYLTAHGSNRVFVIDPIMEERVKELTVGKNPYGIAVIDR